MKFLFLYLLYFMPHFIGLRTLFGVDHSATPDQIKKAYRALARQYHPDLNPTPEAEVMMKKITFAYEVLTEPEKAKIFEQEQKDKKRAAVKAMEKKKKVMKNRKKR